MDDKKMALFSKALLILCEGYCEEHGCTLVGARVVIADSDSPDSRADNAEGQTA